MKARILIIALMIFSTLGFSQETKALFSNENSKTATFGGYGGPLIQATQINNDWGVLLGGKGGVIINGRFAFGGIGMGLVSSMDVIDDDSNGNNDASLDLNYGAGGLFMEYIFNSESPVFFSIPVNLMGGEITLEDPTSDTEVESSGVFIIEPGINVDFRFTSNFVTGINLSYRQVIGSSLDNLSDQDISGVNIGLIFKFGSF